MTKVLGARRLLVLLSVVVAAGLSASAALAASSSPWDVPAPPIPDMSSWGQDPVWQQARARAEAVAAAQRAAVSSPSADAQRDRSATAFDDLSRPEAQELAQQTFPDLMVAPVDALGLPEGDRVTSFLSSTEAQVVDGHGKHFMLLGTQPLAAAEGGPDELAKVDLSLSAQDGALVPGNPAVDIALPDSASDPLTLPDSGLGLSLADGANVVGDVEHDRVFYGDVATDTDYITVAQRQGAEVMWQLRSPQATESPSVDLDLPAGAHAQLTSMLTGAAAGENPSVQVVDDDGNILDTIAAPSAVDADGVSVPARYRLDGRRLYVDVPHREQQVTYPVLVDPAVYEVWGGADWYNMGAGQNGVMAGQWGFTATEGGLGNPWYLTNNANPVGYGMAIESWPGAYQYTAGAGAYDHWGAPPYTNIASVWFDGLYHRTEGDHLFAGVVGPYGWETVYDIPGDTDYQQSSQTPNPAWELSSVVFGVFEDLTTTHPVPGWVAVRGLSILIGDTRPPDDVHLSWIHFNGQDFGYIPAGAGGITTMPWVSSATSIQFQTVVHDLGLGLQHVGIMDGANNWAGNAWHSGCTGNRTSPCTNSIVATQNITTKPGINDYRPVGIDITDNAQFGPTYRLRIDADNPLITLSGAVLDHAQANVPSGPNDTLHVAVTDGNASSPASYQSGVRKVLIQVDGVAQPVWTNGNTDATNNDYGWDYTLPVNTNGTHTVHITAWDAVGNPPGTKDFTFISNPYPTSWNLGRADHAVNTTDELHDVQLALESADTDAAYSALWSGLSPSDRTRTSDFLVSSAPPPAVPVPALTGNAEAFADPNATASAFPPDGAAIRSVDAGACGSIVAQSLGFRSPVPFDAPASFMPASQLYWTLKGPPAKDLTTGRFYKSYFVDIRATPFVQARATVTSGYFKSGDPVTGKSPVKGDSTKRDKSRPKAMPYYYHGTVHVYVGDYMYMQGRVQWAPPLTWTDAHDDPVYYAGDRWPRTSYGDWIRCRA